MTDAISMSQMTSSGSFSKPQIYDSDSNAGASSSLTTMRLTSTRSGALPGAMSKSRMDLRLGSFEYIVLSRTNLTSVNFWKLLGVLNWKAPTLISEAEGVAEN